MSEDRSNPAAQPRPRRRRSGRRGQGRPAAQAPAVTPAPTATSTPPATGTPADAGRTQQRRRRSRSKTKKIGNNVQYPGQVTNDTSVPKTAAPSRRGKKRSRPLVMPRIGVGCVVMRGDEILLVRERGRWSLPKGGLESGELLQDGARRETYEETGLVIELRDLAFVVEFQAESWGHHLQFFYTGREVGGELAPGDPDRDVQEARFVPIRELREYIRFRPRLVSLETWLHERRPRHFVFNLDQEPAMLRRRRPGVGAVRRGSDTEEPDLE
ncbi:NUDIX domain-containing protein [Deinococcus radiophilus]|uniref:NUDIX domain-containing protein n=1 Tax=Deinococcus radiophilus TaxID=32062 RepID=UPI001E60C150|nr:NUDIX hydrolase [Deinococcus radiophilus]UFA49909.1 NUDIX hydrolase [Deinococcus radiophilus]